MGECEGKGRYVHCGGGNVVGRTRPDLSSPLLQTMIVLEYMPKGDLRNYLKSRQPQ